jgi:hypothetical protein
MIKKPLSKKIIILQILSLLTILLIVPLKTASAQWPELTVMANKPEYSANDNVVINGTLKYDGTPVSNVLIGLEVRDREDLPFIFRTLPCGRITQTNWLVNITALYPCNSNGVPTYNFTKGQTVWLFCEIANYDLYDAHYVIICITLYDSLNSPILSKYLTSQTIPKNSSISILTSLIKIETTMPSGTYPLYASTFDGYPRNKGLPYCPEKMTSFTVVNPSNLPPSPPSQDGVYQTSYHISSQVRLGNFTVYVSAYYRGIKATATTTYKAVLKGDINKDNAVNFKDSILLGAAFNSMPGDPNWNQNADLNSDGIINYKDAIILGANFGSSGY